MSPRKFIRYNDNQGKNFMYADNAKIQALITATQNEDMSVTMETVYRVEITKPFLASPVLLRESESGIKSNFKNDFIPAFEPILRSSLNFYETHEKKVKFDAQDKNVPLSSS